MSDVRPRKNFLFFFKNSIQAVMLSLRFHAAYAVFLDTYGVMLPLGYFKPPKGERGWSGWLGGAALLFLYVTFFLLDTPLLYI